MAETPAVLTPAVRDWLAGRHHAVLVTIRRDGTPQTSNISFGLTPTARPSRSR